MGFLDPETMSLSTITCDKSYVVDYLTKALKQLVKKYCIMFAHNIGDKWILGTHSKSKRSKSRDHSLLKDILNEEVVS